VELRGFVARVVQHEVDHLNGILFTDRMTHVKKVALSGRLKRMRRETQERLRIA
jgi:peptide deformylase